MASPSLCMHASSTASLGTGSGALDCQRPIRDILGHERGKAFRSGEGDVGSERLELVEIVRIACDPDRLHVQVLDDCARRARVDEQPRPRAYVKVLKP